MYLLEGIKKSIKKYFKNVWKGVVTNKKSL